jgi:hypothetical protein
VAALSPRLFLSGTLGLACKDATAAVVLVQGRARVSLYKAPQGRNPRRYRVPSTPRTLHPARPLLLSVT